MMMINNYIKCFFLRVSFIWLCASFSSRDNILVSIVFCVNATTVHVATCDYLSSVAAMAKYMFYLLTIKFERDIDI